MKYLWEDLGVERDELVWALLRLPLVVVVVIGLWLACAFIAAMFGTAS